MNILDNREKAIEAKFSREEDFRFRVRARRNRLLGLWVAKALRLDGENADNYADEVVAADMAFPGDDDVVQKVMKDLNASGLHMDATSIKKEMRKLESKAREQLAPSMK